MTPDPRAVKAARVAIEKAGGGAALGRACEVTRFAVNQWRMQGIPAVRVGRVAELTGIPVHELRPDIFPAPDAAASKPGATQDAAA